MEFNQHNYNAGSVNNVRLDPRKLSAVERAKAEGDGYEIPAPKQHITGTLTYTDPHGRTVTQPVFGIRTNCSDDCLRSHEFSLKPNGPPEVK